MCSVRWYAMKITLYTLQNSLHSSSFPVDCLKIKMSDFFTLTGHAKYLRGMTMLLLIGLLLQAMFDWG